MVITVLAKQRCLEIALFVLFSTVFGVLFGFVDAFGNISEEVLSKIAMLSFSRPHVILSLYYFSVEIQLLGKVLPFKYRYSFRKCKSILWHFDFAVFWHKKKECCIKYPEGGSSALSFCAPLILTSNVTMFLYKNFYCSRYTDRLLIIVFQFKHLSLQKFCLIIQTFKLSCFQGFHKQNVSRNRAKNRNPTERLFGHSSML